MIVVNHFQHDFTGMCALAIIPYVAYCNLYALRREQLLVSSCLQNDYTFSSTY